MEVDHKTEAEILRVRLRAENRAWKGAEYAAVKEGQMADKLGTLLKDLFNEHGFYLSSPDHERVRLAIAEWEKSRSWRP